MPEATRAIRPARRDTVIQFARFSLMRSTALVTALAAGLSLAVQMSALAAPTAEATPKKTSEAAPKKASEAAPKKKVPMPRARPVARGGVPKTTAPAATAAKEGVKEGVRETNALPMPMPAAVPAPLPSRQRITAPARRPITPAAVAATSSTSKGDLDALENVIE